MIRHSRRNSAEQRELNVISAHIAGSMLGSEVSLRTGPRLPAHGIVTGVVLDAGTPRIVVNGAAYGLDQVLTVVPAAFNNNLNTHNACFAH
jgi:hypothetical protein